MNVSRKKSGVNSPPLSDEALILIANKFRALSEPNRLKLIQALQDGEKNVTELVDITNLTQANISRHLQTLVEAGILNRRKAKLHAYYFISDPTIFDLCSLVCGSVREKLQEETLALTPG